MYHAVVDSKMTVWGVPSIDTGQIVMDTQPEETQKSSDPSGNRSFHFGRAKKVSKQKIPEGCLIIMESQK